ncbi:hypothetical protein CSW25_10520 [Thermus scotoductus]|jgi:hypothetical protein|uniref:DUF2442 domain-containing protein n=1 Tax=Thermus scotoductus TaxID=37636 RepID=A0A430RD16_THESC|nr:DUF2442 domain-containing protein [Thermus scotoductus]RTG92597.1 hypothetical protein CSW48_12555 [Thermus scotoductus]RTH05229.1 hypothetical protein CSW50_00770 [Thermus scotoductus]RTH06037.1 hypothetical protein CSW46_13490 [Thermus scotoductus]RTH10081.1 hypothetical protein CSW43_09980 [Thermus scotoductus]RTH14084.1 hypothetical protein CSW44_00405 [Thermus scotoductus]
MVTADLLKQIEAARKAGELAQQSEPAARHARYNPVSREIEIELRDGRRVSISVDLIQGLQGASDEELSRVKVTPAGTGLYWEDLDVDISVPFLLKGIYGTRAWMAELGRRGGKVKSAAKAAAARENGKKGGRPRKSSASKPEEASVVSKSHKVELHLPRTLYQQLQQEAQEEGVTLENYLLTLVIQGASYRRMRLEVRDPWEQLGRMERWGVFVKGRGIFVEKWPISTPTVIVLKNLGEGQVAASGEEDFRSFRGVYA